MRITIENTERIVELATRAGASLPARVWQGTTDRGVDVIVFVTRIAALHDADLAEFDADLAAQPVPAFPDVAGWPSHMIID